MKKNNKINSSGLPRLVREMNLQAVTRAMRRKETFSKIDLARECGISTTTMTKLFAQLVAGNLIEKSPELDKSYGRPKIFFHLATIPQIAAIVINVEQTTLCFSSLQGNVAANRQTTFATGKNTKTLFSNICNAYKTLQKKLNAPCQLIGVCIPGLIEADSGKSALNPNIRWLEGSCPAPEISRQLSIPAFSMHEEKALSRAQFSLADDSPEYIALDFSAGVGMNVVANGKHVAGTSGFAGEIGHVILQPNGSRCGCGKRGCLETMASDRVFQTETGLSMKKALQQLADGTPKIVDTADRIIAAQAAGVAMAINIFNPELVFVYSRLADAYPEYIKTLRRQTEKRAIGVSFNKCSIETAREGKLKGALLLTIDHLIAQAICSH